ncbi:hypothetical protein Hanom_Chr02g00138081 [Helianthus anomalus]
MAACSEPMEAEDSGFSVCDGIGMLTPDDFPTRVVISDGIDGGAEELESRFGGRQWGCFQHVVRMCVGFDTGQMYFCLS